jgi:hypothetical protein
MRVFLLTFIRGSAYSPSRPRFNVQSQSKPIPRELEEAAFFWGIYSRLARRLHVTPQAVRQVALGITTSKRISGAIEREIQRINAKREERAA